MTEHEAKSRSAAPISQNIIIHLYLAQTSLFLGNFLSTDNPTFTARGYLFPFCVHVLLG